jgi:hypothetical protein
MIEARALLSHPLIAMSKSLPQVFKIIERIYIPLTEEEKDRTLVVYSPGENGNSSCVSVKIYFDDNTEDTKQIIKTMIQVQNKYIEDDV